MRHASCLPQEKIVNRLRLDLTRSTLEADGLSSFVSKWTSMFTSSRSRPISMAAMVAILITALTAAEATEAEEAVA